MSKIVVLNSGGFDSVVLMNYLHFIQEEDEIYSLHFAYGENNEKEQCEYAQKVSDRVGAVHKVIALPPIDWTKSDFFKDSEYESKAQYLEYRNLIFLSYALSYAESIGADKIYVAFINNSQYPDTSVEFLNGLNSFCSPASGIVIDAPFIFDNKIRLGHIAKYLGVTKDDYISCDKPINGKPCGVCPDCIALKEIEAKINGNIF